eukprot:g13009.t2
MPGSSVAPEVTDNLPGVGDALPNSSPPGNSSERGGTLEVVCPNYGRTGSTSMHMALEILGFGPCYHMEKVLRVHPKDHPQLWLDAFQGRGVAVHKIFDGYKSVADWPGAQFYKEILASNPTAKVVVTVRDPDAWWKSVESTISFNNPTMSSWVRTYKATNSIDSSVRWGGHSRRDTPSTRNAAYGFFFVDVFSADTFLFHSMIRQIKTLHMNEEEAKADYIRHNKEILAHVPADKLLEFSVKQGWEPLCAFLGVRVPDEPFPNVKSGDVMKTRFTRINNRGWRLMMTTSVVAGASVVAASFFGGKRAGRALAAAELGLLISRIHSVVSMRRLARKQALVEMKG